MAKVRIRPSNYKDRGDLCRILAEAGLPVHVEIVERAIGSDEYWVVFEVPDTLKGGE